MNTVLLSGRLTKNPELLKSKSGTFICTGIIAVKSKMKTESKEGKTIFVTFNCYGKVAENLYKYIKKGAMVLITGFLDINAYKKDEKNLTCWSVIAENVEYLPKSTPTEKVDSEKIEDEKVEKDTEMEEIESTLPF